MQTSQKPATSADVLVSVIICTCGRATALQNLLRAIESQTYGNFEILIIDGNDEPSPAREAVEDYLTRSRLSSKLSLIKSEKGLTRQRNVGLEAAKGEIICFFDDDVTFGNEFLSKAVAMFAQPDMQDVGGITPYDTLHYPYGMSLRWKLRALLGVMPSFHPGDCDRLGRAVPISFLTPFAGNKEVGWLPGFGMIYRRSSVQDLRFDELLPTYGGEDREFSMRVGWRQRLLVSGDLHLEHHYSRESRNDGLHRLRESSFGAGRRFAKYRRGFRDDLIIAQTFFGDFLVDVIAFARSPRPINFFTIFVRLQASFDGLRSVNKGQRAVVSSSARYITAPASSHAFERNDVRVLAPNERDS